MIDDIFTFLKLLRENNNREWFHANKQLYDDARAKVELITMQLIGEISKFEPLPACGPKNAFTAYIATLGSHPTKLPTNVISASTSIPLAERKASCRDITCISSPAHLW